MDVGVVFLEQVVVDDGVDALFEVAKGDGV